MSGNEAPRRRRIAGESGPGTPPVKKTPPVRKPPSKPPVAKKPPVVKKPAAPSAPSAAPVTPRMAPVTTDASSGDSARSTRSIGALALAVIAGLALTAGLVLSAIALLGGGDSSRSDSDVRAAAEAASAASETIFSFTFDDLDAHLVESKALMTPQFSDEFDEIAPSLTELAPQRKVQVEAVARASAPVECGDECADDTVTALVFVDQVRLIGGDKQPTVFANRIEVTMKKSDGRWLVDDIRAL